MLINNYVLESDVDDLRMAVTVTGQDRLELISHRLTALHNIDLLSFLNV